MLHVQGMHKSYGSEEVLKGVSFSVPANEVLSILGRSGSGKTTLLKCMAGLEQQGQGQVMVNNEDLSDVPPQKRGMVYLYQETLLFPHLNVFENVAFGLRLRKLGSSAVNERVEGMLEELGLQDHAHKMPHQLSGGQQQRVSFGRSIIINPRLLLLDEPFGNLDTKTREQMQALFRQMADKHGITAVFVTHDLKEALRMGDNLALMQAGVLKTFESKDAFINDAETGVKEEMAFWKGLG